MDLQFFERKSDEERAKLRALRVTRPNYQEERILHNFLLDAYVGGGGFQNGIIPSPDVPFWGRRAYERGRSEWLENRTRLLRPRDPVEPGSRAYAMSTSYVLPFHGEEMDSFCDRVTSSVYHNPAEKIVRFTNSLLMQDDAQREGLPPILTEWLRNVDRRGRALNHIARNLVLYGQIFGWGAALTDTPVRSAPSLADSMRLGMQPYLTLICPQEILDWDCSPDGTVLAAKTSLLCEHPRSSMFDPKLWEEHIQLWYPDGWERYVVLLPPAETCSDPTNPELGRIIRQDSGPNPSGRVPLSFFAWDEGLGGVSSYGLPQIFNIAKVAWEIFQINSELRRMMRDQVFALLIRERTTGGANGTAAVGPANFLTESEKYAGNTRFIAPPPAPAQIYETRMESLNEQLHRMSGVDSGAKKVSETAEAMRVRFQMTSAMLTNAATNVERWELDALRLVGGLFGIREDVLMRMSVTRPKNFDVGRYTAQIDDATKALKMPWGPAALTQILRRTLRSIVPNVNPELMTQLDAEVETTVTENYDRILAAVVGAGASAPDPVQDQAAGQTQADPSTGAAPPVPPRSGAAAVS